MQSVPIFRLIAGGGITPLGPFVRGGLLDGVELAPQVSGGLLGGALLAADAGQQNGVSPSLPERVIPDTPPQYAIPDVPDSLKPDEVPPELLPKYPLQIEPRGPDGLERQRPPIDIFREGLSERDAIGSGFDDRVRTAKENGAMAEATQRQLMERRTAEQLREVRRADPTFDQVDNAGRAKLDEIYQGYQDRGEVPPVAPGVARELFRRELLRRYGIPDYLNNQGAYEMDIIAEQQRTKARLLGL